MLLTVFCWLTSVGLFWPNAYPSPPCSTSLMVETALPGFLGFLTCGGFLVGWRQRLGSMFSGLPPTEQWEELCSSRQGSNSFQEALSHIDSHSACALSLSRFWKRLPVLCFIRQSWLSMCTPLSVRHHSVATLPTYLQMQMVLSFISLLFCARILIDIRKYHNI